MLSCDRCEGFAFDERSAKGSQSAFWHRGIVFPKSAADRQLKDCIAEKFEPFVGRDRFLVIFVAKRAMSQGLLKPSGITKAVLEDIFDFC